MLRASRAFLSFSAAYLDLPLGYCSSPEIFLEADTDSSGVWSLDGSDPRTAEVRDLAKYRLTKLSPSFSLVLVLGLLYPAPLSELSSRLNLLSASAELEGEGSGELILLLNLRAVPGLRGVGSVSCPHDPAYPVVFAPP